MTSPPPPAADPGQVALLRADLEAAGYTVERIEELVGPVAAEALRRDQGVPASRALRRTTDPAAALTRLFVLGEAVHRRELDAALPGLSTRGAQGCGLVRVAGQSPDDEVRAAVDLAAYSAQDAAGEVRWWLASDVGELGSGRALPADHVLGVGGASITLARLTVRQRVGRTLDLGTGCGIQALHAARHSGAVVATDLSRRALAFARFNAALAGTDLDLREGSMLEPVDGERFDLVVSNPPFVITPRSPGSTAAAAQGGLPSYDYRDAGSSGDDVVRDLVTGIGDVLAPGGLAQLLGNWEHRVGQDWRERVTGWLEASGLDGWVVQREVADPAEYAETWMRDGGLTPDRDAAAWRSAYEAWLADFESRAVEGVGFGYVILRRPAADRPRWLRVEEHLGPVRQPLGVHVAAVLAAQDWLEANDDAALAAAHLSLAPDVTEERHLVPGEQHPRVVLLRQGGGFGRATPVSSELAGFVGACDGELSAGQIVGALGALLDVPAGELAAGLLPAVRELVRDGLLIPAG